MRRKGRICGGTCGRDLATVPECIEAYWGGPLFCHDCGWCEKCEEYFCPCKFVWVKAKTKPAQQELAL